MKFLITFFVLIFNFIYADDANPSSVTQDSTNLNADTKTDTTTQNNIDDNFDTEFKYRLTNSVNVQIIDKISGEVIIKKLKINEMFAFKRIRVVIRKCFVSPIDKPLNYIGFVEIYHIPYSKNIEKVFSNWMFTENITINMFEHPVYDVKIIK